MRKCFLLLFIFLWPLFLSAETTLKEKFLHAQPGAYIVTEQNKTFSVLHLHSISGKRILLEEVSIPSAQIPGKNMDWKKWLQGKAPSHSSWIMYEIDLEEDTILECFSFSRNAWLTYDSSDAFLAKLFILPLKEVPSSQRKRIGPPPLDRSEDCRKIWNPPLFREGKKQTAAQFDVFQTTWPKDESDLSRKDLLLYFEKNSSFPFPYWIQISDGSNAMKVRSVDSGTRMASPYGSIPRRPPQFLGTVQKKPNCYQIKIKTPPYFKDLHIYALDVNNFGQMIPLSFTLLPDEEKDAYWIQLPKDFLEKQFIKGHCYRFLAVPKETAEAFAETAEDWQY